MSMRKLFPKADTDQIGRYVCQPKNSQNVLNFPSERQTTAIVTDDPRHGLQLIFARREKCPLHKCPGKLN